MKEARLVFLELYLDTSRVYSPRVQSDCRDANAREQEMLKKKFISGSLWQRNCNHFNSKMYFGGTGWKPAMTSQEQRSVLLLILQLVQCNPQDMFSEFYSLFIFASHFLCLWDEICQTTWSLAFKEIELKHSIYSLALSFSPHLMSSFSFYNPIYKMKSIHSC